MDQCGGSSNDGTSDKKFFCCPNLYSTPTLLKVDNSRPLFLFYKQFNKVADRWIRTRVLWYRKRSHYQLCPNSCPSRTPFLLFGLPLFRYEQILNVGLLLLGQNRPRKYHSCSLQVFKLLLKKFGFYWIGICLKIVSTCDGDQATLEAKLSSQKLQLLCDCSS